MTPWKQSIGGGLTCLLLIPATAGGADTSDVTTTVYVGRHFEVRDHDQPIKYVFNGGTRVARISGSLSGNSRIQRLRLQPGWNLCSVAVGGAPLPAQAGLISAYWWNQVAGQYEPVTPTDSLAAGTVLWIQANAPTVISLSGGYVDPASTTWPPGATFRGNTGLAAMALALPAGVTIWKFDSATQRWRAGLAGDLTGLNELPPRLAPGEAIYVHTAETIAAPVPDPAQRVAYYHQDHLGSAGVVTDAAGSLIEETAHYPFGTTRHAHPAQPFQANYGFTQKERDRESGLHYFEARYLAGPVARFVSADPLLVGERGTAVEGVLNRPQRLHPYAYAMNNPLRLIDADGRDPAPASVAKPATPLRTRSGQKINIVAADMAGPNLVRDLWTSYYRNVADPTIDHRDWTEWKSSDPDYVKKATSGEQPQQFTALFLSYEGSTDTRTDWTSDMKTRVSIRTFYASEKAQNDPAVHAAATARTAQIVEYLQKHPLPKFRNILQPEGYYSSQKSVAAFSEQQEQYEAKMYQSFENRGTEKSK